MLKRLLQSIVMLGICILLTGCPTPYIMTEGVRLPETIRYNLICFTGNSTDSIEVSYSEYDPISGKNKVITQTVTPPCIIGGHEVLIEKTYMTYNKDKHVDTAFYFKCGYGEGAFLNITNKSNQPIEFCFIPTQQLISGKVTSCDNRPYFDCYPTVNYNDLPLYYWMFPEKNSHWGDFSFGDCLPITWKTPNKTLNIDEVMQLYRDEYSGSNNNILYLNYEPAYSATNPNEKRLRLKNFNNTEDGEYIKYQYKYYGSIAASSTLNMGIEYPVLAVPTVNGFVSINYKDSTEYEVIPSY